MTASPPYPDSCNLKEAKTLLLKFIVDAETDGEMKDELPLLQKWLESQHADEASVNHAALDEGWGLGGPPREWPRVVPLRCPFRIFPRLSFLRISFLRTADTMLRSRHPQVREGGGT